LKLISKSTKYFKKVSIAYVCFQEFAKNTGSGVASSSTFVQVFQTEKTTRKQLWQIFIEKIHPKL